MTRFGSIIIPAWNEGAVIADMLGTLARDGVDRLFSVIVVANACTDDTAARARAAMPGATVLETATAGKTRAMNLGLAAALPGQPVLFLDADLDLRLADLIALARPLRSGGAQAACGTMLADTSAASWPVRAYYRAWALNPYFARGKFGGLFGLSAAGADRVFPLPPVTADDEYIRRAFAGSETAFVGDCRFSARAPRDLATLIRVRRRSLRGARALSASGHARAAGKSAGAMLRAVAGRPALWPAMAVYLAVQLVVRAQLALEPAAAASVWERDLTNRIAGGLQ